MGAGTAAAFTESWDDYSPDVDEQYVGDAELNALTGELIAKARSGRRTRAQLDWFVNRRWYAGEPWWRQREEGVLDFLLPHKRGSYVNTQVLFQAIEVLTGSMTYLPKADASPTSNDPQDIFRARAAASLGNHLIRSSGLYDAFGAAICDIHVTGLAWLNVGWDPEDGPVRPTFRQEICEMCGGEGVLPGGYLGTMPVPCIRCHADGVEPGQVSVPIGEEPMGDVYCEYVPCHEIYHDAIDIKKMRRLARETLMSKAEAYQRFARYVGLDEDKLESSRYARMSIEGGDGLYGGEEDFEADMVTVTEYWETPSQRFPDGVYGLHIGDHVITFGRNPYAHRRIPYVPLTAYEQVGSPYPKSTADYILPLVHALNEHVSAYHARAKQSSKLNILAHLGHRILLPDEHGIIKHDTPRGSHEPKVLQYPSTPDVGELIQLFMGWIKEISGATDIVAGTVPTSDSARALAWLEDRAATRFRRMRQRHAQALQDVIRLMLETARLFYTDGRLYSVFGTGKGASALRAYKMDDTGYPQDVIIDVSPDQHRSRSARLAALNEAMANGGLQDPVYMEHFDEFGTTDAMHEMRAMHESRAFWENQQLVETGAIDPPIEGEDHAVHIRLHDTQIHELRISQPGSPLIEMALEHRRAHLRQQATETLQNEQYQAEAAAAFGLANSADPAAQPQAAIDGAIATGAQPAVETTQGGSNAN